MPRYGSDRAPTGGPRKKVVRKRPVQTRVKKGPGYTIPKATVRRIQRTKPRPVVRPDKVTGTGHTRPTSRSYEKGVSAGRLAGPAKPVAGRVKVPTVSRGPVAAVASPVADQAKKELEGKGLLVGASSAVKGVLDSKAGKVAFRQAMSAAGAPQVVAEQTRKGTKDFLDMAANAPASVYVPVAAGWEAAHGDSKRLKRLGNELKNNDPLVLAAQGRLKEAGKVAWAHPGIAGVELFGLGRGTSRGAGSVLRHTPVKGAKKYASQERPKATTEGTNIKVKRQYSRGVVENRVQKRRERKKVAEAQKLYGERDRLRESSPDESAEAARRAGEADPTVASGGELRHRVDERADLNNSIQRLERDRTVEEANKVSKKASDASSLVVQSIAKPTVKSVQEEVARLAKEGETLSSPVRRAQNIRTRKRVTKSLKRFDPEREAKVAKDYKAIMDPLEAEADRLGILPAAEAFGANVKSYAVTRMGARWDAKAKRLMLDGEELTPARISLHMQANGYERPGFLTHRPNAGGSGNFYRSSESAQGLSRATRTGESARVGLYDTRPVTLVENAARLQTVISAVKGWRGTVKEFGVRDKTGEAKTFTGSRAKANEEAANLSLESQTGQRFEAIPLNPIRGRTEQLKSLLDSVAEGEITEPLMKLIGDGMDNAEYGDWGFVPREVANRLREHTQALGGSSAEKVWGKAQQLFRRNVLPTSTRWMVGNAVEAVLRRGINGATPGDVRLFRKAVAEVRRTDPALADQIEARAITGGNVGGLTARMPRRGAEQFKGTGLEGKSAALGRFWEAPGPKAMADGWHMLTDGILGLNLKFERHTQRAMAGKAMRQEGLVDGYKFKKLSDKAVKQAAEGLRGTDEMVAIGRAVDRAYGRYSKFSPFRRKVSTQYTPFIAWYINSIVFLTKVMPLDHPVMTVLLAQASQVSRQEREKYGLVIGGKGAVPLWEMGSVPAPGGRLSRVARYTPFGIAADPFGNAAGQVLPSVDSAVSAAKGQDWTGRRVKNPEDQVARGLRVGGALAGSFIPGVSVVSQTANRKGNVGEKIRKQFNPLEPVDRSTAPLSEAEKYVKKDGKYVLTAKGERIFTPAYVKWLDEQKARRKGKVRIKGVRPPKPSTPRESGGGF